MPYVTGEDILAHARVPSPSAEDEAWADVVADAIEGVISHYMEDTTVDPGSDAEREIVRAALDDGAAAYARRDAPHGVLTIGPDGQTTRLGAELTLALRPVLRRYGPVGLA